MLHKPAPATVLAKVAPGDLVDLQAEERRLAVYTCQGRFLGEVEPKLANRLLRLIRQGNRYSGAVVGVQHPRIAVALREVYTHPSLLGIASFPSSGLAGSGPQPPQAYARLDMEPELDDEDVLPGWSDDYDGAIDGEVGSPVGRGFDKDDDEVE